MRLQKEAPEQVVRGAKVLAEAGRWEVQALDGEECLARECCSGLEEGEELIA